GSTVSALCMSRPKRFSIQSYVYAPPRGEGPICAIHGQTDDGGASIVIARVATPSASFNSSSPGSHASASSAVAPQVSTGSRRYLSYATASSATGTIPNHALFTGPPSFPLIRIAPTATTDVGVRPDSASSNYDDGRGRG